MYTGLHEGGNTFGKLSSDLSIFMAFRKPYRTVLAFRFGGEKNFGDHEFYHAASLGGRTNLRGFRDTRYAGDASLYQNTEIRFKISKIKTYMARGSFGLLAFNDLGRVWLDGEHSSKWHHGYGGGFWFSPFNMGIVTLQYERSVDEKNGLVSLRTGFRF